METYAEVKAKAKAFFEKCLNSTFYNFVEGGMLDMTIEDKLCNLKGTLKEIKDDPEFCKEALISLISDTEEEARQKGYCPNCGNPMERYWHHTPGVCDNCGHSEEEL